MNDSSDRVRRPHEFADAEGYDGEQDPPGEMQGEFSVFRAEQVAAAFEVEVDRVYNAFRGEFGLGRDGEVDSRQAQHLAEVIIGDRPQAEREAALMQLGAFTPRRDTLEPSVSEKPPGELSDSLRPEGRKTRSVGAPKEPGL